MFLGPSCVFTNVTNPRSAVSRKDQYKETVIGKGVLGSELNATIMLWTYGRAVCHDRCRGGGNEGCSAYALVVGNPSRQIGWCLVRPSPCI